MKAWKATYRFSNARGETRAVLFYVTAPTCGDVPEIVRNSINWDEDISVDEVHIMQMSGRELICSKHVDGSVHLEVMKTDA